MRKLIELQNISGANNKKDILCTLSEMEKRVFFYALNFNYTYKIKNFDTIEDLQEPNENMFMLLDSLINREISGSDAREAVNVFALEFGGLIKMICQKRLACGVSVTTVNSVFPKYIPEFKVQLAKEATLDTITYPIMAQLKYDGIRVIIKKSGDDIRFYTRKGHELTLLLTKECFKSDLSYVLDCEVTLVDGTVEDRTTVSGLLNSARQGTIIDERQLQFNVFDYLSVKQFEDGCCPLSYSKRYKQANIIVQSLDRVPILNIELAKNYLINSQDELEALYSDFIKKGQEGLILKKFHHMYTFKRTKDWKKMKETKEADLKCIDTTEGKGKREGMIGALTCVGIVEGEKVNVNVSGLTEILASSNTSEFIGKTIEVKYNSVIKDTSTNTYSLFLPRFSRVRFDK